MVIQSRSIGKRDRGSLMNKGVRSGSGNDELESAALFAAIEQAHVAIRPRVPVTPLALSVALSGQLGCTVLLKNEHLQPTGSFKYRGATNRVRLLSEEQRRRGVITASTGNHGLAVAQAGALADVGVTVYVAHSAAAAKRAAISALGGALVVVDGPVVEAELAARRDAAAQGKVFISPYNDAAIIAGQGTTGVELAGQAPDLDAVFVAVGGGGLIGGIGTALRRLLPEAEIVGVWPENAPAMLRALEAGAIVDTVDLPTLSDGTAGAVEPGSITFPICQAVIDRTVTVSRAGDCGGDAAGGGERSLDGGRLGRCGARRTGSHADGFPRTQGRGCAVRPQHRLG